MPGPSQTFEPPSRAAIARAPATSAVVEAVPAAVWPEVEAKTWWYAVACVLAMDPGSWFNHAYLARSAKRRRQPQDVAEVIARLPPAVATTLRHYVWLMDRTTADIEAELRSLGVAMEREVWPGLRAYVDRIDHWTPMDRFRKGVDIFSELWWSDPGDSVNPVTAYEHIWRSASDLAPITLRDARLGFLRARSLVPAKLILEVRGKAWWITVPDDRVDEDASTALLNRAVAAKSRARFQIAKLVRGGQLGLFFGAPEGLEPLVARYRLDEPYFNLATPRAPVDQRACRPTAPGKSPYRSPAPAPPPRACGRASCRW
ncbi:MAG TPA: hypothetical protein PK095_02235 [Myxococcota bacterium]|nr:hypothetical protein [Myxococcota bacterium]